MNDTIDDVDQTVEVAEELAVKPAPKPKEMQRLMGALMGLVQTKPHATYNELEEMVDRLSSPERSEGVAERSEANINDVEDVKKNLIFRFGRSASRKARRSAAYSKAKAQSAANKVRPWAGPVKEWTLEFVIAFSVAFTFTFLIAYLFTISPLAAWVILAGLMAQVLATCISWAAKVWARYKVSKRENANVPPDLALA